MAEDDRTKSELGGDGGRSRRPMSVRVLSTWSRCAPWLIGSLGAESRECVVVVFVYAALRDVRVTDESRTEVCSARGVSLDHSGHDAFGNLEAATVFSFVLLEKHFYFL